MKPGIAILSLVLAACAPAISAGSVAQQVRTLTDDTWCRDGDRGDRDRERYCEVREVTLPADRQPIAVDATPNGGVSVEGWDRNEILLRAKVQAQARTESAARVRVREVTLETANTITADGPGTGRHEGWSVSYRLFVPRRSNLDLRSTNGGITIEAVDGAIEFRTTNGGITLLGLKGDVRGSTNNGGVHIALTGDEWQGVGLDVRTTNGGVKIDVPDHYSARLESGTVNGTMRMDFPITVLGRINRRIEAELGGGGKTIRAVTTNGSVTIRRS